MMDSSMGMNNQMAQANMMNDAMNQFSQVGIGNGSGMNTNYGNNGMNYGSGTGTNYANMNTNYANNGMNNEYGNNGMNYNTGY